MFMCVPFINSYYLYRAILLYLRTPARNRSISLGLDMSLIVHEMLLYYIFGLHGIPFLFFIYSNYGLLMSNL